MYAQGEWTAPAEVGDGLRVEATFPTFGSIKGYAVTVAFDTSDRIVRLDETVTMYPSPAAADRFPAVVRTAINGALANGTPIVVGYTGKDGAPVLSSAAAHRCPADTELCMWVRNPKGGLVDAARAGQTFSLLYRDSSRRMTLVMSGRASIAEGAARDRVWSLIPEVEKRHDPPRNGVAVLIQIQRCAGNTPSGPVNVQRK